jgi:long-chain acyl-CoA synthetase
MLVQGSLGEWVEGQTVTRWLSDGVRQRGDRVALRARAADGSWQEVTWAQVGDRSARVAGGLQGLGIGAGDIVLLMLRNRPEFHVADLGALLLRATPVSIYNTSAPEQVAYLAGHCRAKVAIVDDLGFLARILEVRDELPDLQHVVVVSDPEGLAPEGVLHFEDLLGADPVDLEAAAAAADPSDLVTLIYTSGTTGAPKGVMIDHVNLAWEVGGYAIQLESATEDHVVPSYLPMAHIAERMVSHYSWVFEGIEVVCVSDLAELGATLAEVHPHRLFGPPRVWEKLQSGIMAAVAAAGEEKAAQFAGALGVGKQVDELERAGLPVPEPLAQMHAAIEQMAFAPLRQRVGLDRMEIAFSGAAPLPVAVAEFFRSIGVPFSEVYGMSENTGGMTWSPYAGIPGRVGVPWPGAEVRLADDGEVLCRGGIVSRGYFKDPQRTEETFDADGWLHTGDIGEFDESGQLRIVDRKKELIITAGGKNISPANLEAQLKSIPLVGQAAVVGDNRPYLIALLVLDPDRAPAWAAANGIEGRTLAELAEEPAVLAEIDRGVAAANEHFNHAEQVKKWAVIGEEWLPDSLQLTATMKLKRRGVLRAYGPLIDELYGEASPLPG